MFSSDSNTSWPPADRNRVAALEERAKADQGESLADAAAVAAAAAAGKWAVQ